MSNNDNLRDRNLLRLFLALNVGLAGAFVAYLVLSRNNQPVVLPTAFPAAPPAPVKSATLAPPPHTNAPSSLPPESTPPSPAPTPLAAARSAHGPAASGPASPPSSLATGASSKRFTWEDVESPGYPAYLERLRAAGCPEDRIRAIVASDIETLFAQRRLKEAVAHDLPWWRPQSDYVVSNALQEKGRRLEEQRRDLVQRLLGADNLAPESERPELALWSNVPLTGPVLGALPPDRHARVQEICGQALDRQQAAVWAGLQDHQPVNHVEMARLREQTRADLRQVLNPLELEEFLLRYSQIAHALRQEFSGFAVSPEEFRKVFRAVDTLEHPMQLQFGGLETMSAQQRARYEHQREAAIREALGPERHQAYLLSRDPLYRQAQIVAAQQNAPPQALMPLYQLAKTTEAKRQKILTDASLTPELRNQALNTVQLEQAESIRAIVRETAAPR